MDAFLIVGEQVRGVIDPPRTELIDDILKRWKAACSNDISRDAVEQDVEPETVERCYLPTTFLTWDDLTKRDALRMSLGFIVAASSGNAQYMHCPRLPTVFVPMEEQLEHIYKRRVQLATERWDRFARWARPRAEDAEQITAVPSLLMILRGS